MPNTHEFLSDLETSTRQIVCLLDTIPYEIRFLRKPDKWSVAECVEHLLIVESGIRRVISGSTEPIEGRASDSKVLEIKNTLLDFSRKLHAPQAIAPKGNYVDFERLLTDFTANRAAVQKAATVADPTLLCLGFEHALFGKLSILEWIYFIVYHTERHMQQIAGIYREFDPVKSD